MTTIIPAIDLIGGKCVRLTKGDYNSEKVYHENPVDMASFFEESGATHLHIVDLEAAGGHVDAHKDLIKQIINNTSMKIQIGGGIKKADQIEFLLSCGASQVIIGSKAQTDKDLVIGWMETFGSERIIIGADVNEGMIATHGWKRTSGESLVDFISVYRDAGAKDFLCTDIAKDGMLEGPSLSLYQQMKSIFKDISLIASGGVTSEQDIKDLIHIGMNKIIVGKAIYENRMDIGKLINDFQVC
jgi:phosphoribosylformimino-5-aminoimidazole carboxamide ribotide isomerase